MVEVVRAFGPKVWTLQAAIVPPCGDDEKSVTDDYFALQHLSQPPCIGDNRKY